MANWEWKIAGDFIHRNSGHSHSYLCSFPLITIHIPKLESYFHSYVISIRIGNPIPIIVSTLCDSIVVIELS